MTFTADEMSSLYDIEVMAKDAGQLVAQCQRCGGRMSRDGSMSVYYLVEMFVQHGYSCTSDQEVE